MAALLGREGKVRQTRMSGVCAQCCQWEDDSDGRFAGDGGLKPRGADGARRGVLGSHVPPLGWS